MKGTDTRQSPTATIQSRTVGNHRTPHARPADNIPQGSKGMIIIPFLFIKNAGPDQIIAAAFADN